MAAKLSGSGGGSKYVVEQNSEINVTPFVDVMLVLLIIFMVSAPLATVSIKLDLPPATNPTNEVEEPVYISIQGEGEIYIVDRATSLETLPADLAGALGGPAPTEERVMVRANADVLYEDFMEVLNILQDNGFYQVGLISEDIS